VRESGAALDRRQSVVVVGAGSAGLVAAIFARGGGRDVVLVDSTADGGRKILISGGGRCNVLPAALEPERFVTASSPVLLRRMLRSWPLEAQKAFFEQELGVSLAFEAVSRKYFPRSNRARDVRDALVAGARRAGVRFLFDTRVTAVRRDDAGWRVESSGGAIDAASVIVATGGLSVPKTGSDGAGFRIARDFDHEVHETYPALTPLTLEPPRHAGLSGISLDVRLRARWKGRTTEACGGFLFTHRGYSGPAVLDVSHVAVRSRGARDPAAIRVQWTDATADEWSAELARGTSTILAVVRDRLPERLAEQLLEEAGVPLTRRTAELRRAERIALLDRLTAYPLEWTGDEGYQKAEVTGGGVALGEVDPKSCESRRHPGLFFCGEVLDAFGPIGGHNFAWAWATGRLAGLGAGRAGDSA
jgi:predicted Rossmann fold flavoprotein